MNTPEPHAALAAVLTGRAPGPRTLDELLALEASAAGQGVAPLLVRRLGQQGSAPLEIAGRWAREASVRTATDLLHEGLLREALASLAADGIPTLLFKGAALAWTVYPRPDLRPRLDADLLVRPGDAGRAGAALERLGYMADVQAGTDAVLYQCPYTRTVAGVPHVIDLHWRLCNPAIFERVADVDELLADSVPVTALGPAARAPGLVHALLIACTHRVAHHRDDDRLVWLYDLHLLGERMDDAAWHRLAREAADRGVFEVCRAGLARARAYFNTPVPTDLLEAPVRAEASARYLSPSPSQARVVLEDLQARRGWHERWRAVRSHVLPPAAYMRQVYAPGSRSPLAWLYARRAVTGARRWLTGSSGAWGLR